MGRLLCVGCPAYALQVGLQGLPECQHTHVMREFGAQMLKRLVVHSQARWSCYPNACVQTPGGQF